MHCHLTRLPSCLPLASIGVALVPYSELNQPPSPFLTVLFMYNAANQQFDNGNIPHPRRPTSALRCRCFQSISNLRFRGRRSNPIWRRPEQLRKTCMIFCRSKTATIHVIDTHLKAQICCPSNIIPIKYEIPFRSP